MAKLYPPYLEGTIPAFYGDSISVPFSMNRAVGKADVRGFSLVFKSIQTGSLLFSLSTLSYSFENNVANFTIPSDYKKYLHYGQSYKVQLAYIDSNGTTGYYSTVAIVKYTKEPKIEIADLVKGAKNKHIYNYVGKYTTDDPSEKMYSCQFIVYNQKKEVLLDTGEIIHNSLEDESSTEASFFASEQYNLIRELDSGKNYYIQFKVVTTGLMELETPLYQIVQSESIPLAKTLVVNAELDFDDGFIEVSMRNYDNSSLKGKYALSRSSSEDNFKSWHEIMRFSINGAKEKKIWRDFTFAQGVEYKYAVFMIDEKNNYSTKAVSEIVLGDFEDTFLFDGDQQLKVRFDPKVTGFKNTTLESVTNTIGGKYPVFQRNGQVKYKQFSISGLLSHQLDNSGFFLPALAKTKAADIDGSYSTQLNAENFSAERDFKLEVLDWLSNGKTKIFRSPGEGNYIVKLTNVSLTPNDTVGRLLHSFSATAYEIQEYNHENLVEVGIIKDSLLIGLNSIMGESSQTYYLQELKESENFLYTIGLESATGISFSGITDSTCVNLNGVDVDISKVSDLSSFTVSSLKKTKGQEYRKNEQFTLYFEKEEIPEINPDISGVESVDLPAVEFCGKSVMYSSNNYRKNLLTTFMNTTTDKLISLFSIKCERRVMPIVYANDNWGSLDGNSSDLYQDEECQKLMAEDDMYLYQVYYSLDGKTKRHLGYQDQGECLQLSKWTTLETKNDLFKLIFKDESGKETGYIIPEAGKTFTANDIDFDNVAALYGSLGLKITITCRLSSEVLKNKEDSSTVLNEIKKFGDIIAKGDSEKLMKFLEDAKEALSGGAK